MLAANANWHDSVTTWISESRLVHRKLLVIAAQSRVFVSFAGYEWLEILPSVRNYSFFDADTNDLSRWLKYQVEFIDSTPFRIYASQDDNWWGIAGGQIRISNMAGKSVTVLLPRPAWISFVNQLLGKIASAYETASQSNKYIAKNYDFSAQVLKKSAYIFAEIDTSKEISHALLDKRIQRKYAGEGVPGIIHQDYSGEGFRADHK